MLLGAPAPDNSPDLIAPAGGFDDQLGGSDAPLGAVVSEQPAAVGIGVPLDDTSGLGAGRAFLLRSPPPTACDPDLDGDGDTDVFDFGIFAGNFGSTGLTPNTGGDLDGNGDVDVFDFGAFAGGFGCNP